MHHFTYQIPKSMHISTEIPIINEQGKTVFLLLKQPHKFPASIFNAALRSGIPDTYKITNSNGNPMYSIECWFPGIRYKIIDNSSSQTVSILQHRVHLIEKAYSFKISNHEYYFEKDYTGTGHLKCDSKTIAIVSMPFPVKKSKELTINIVADTEEIASLATVLFFTFYYYNF